MRASSSSIVLSIVVAAGLAGCSGKVPGQIETIPIKGTITLDGQPFGPAKLMLKPDSPSKPEPSAVVDEKGVVTVTTYTAGDGAPAGAYKVVISGDPMTKTPDHPVIYENYEQSPLSLTVASGSKEFKLELDSKQGPSGQGGMGIPLGVRPGTDPAAAYRNAAPAKGP